MKSVKKLNFLLWFLLSFSGYTQDQKINKLVDAFDEYRNENYEEKIYLHLDRPSYLTGETMWFKIYLVDASFHIPSTLSKVVYVEILDQDAKPVIQSKIEVNQGKGNGSLFIPATMNTGNYQVRAYTNWMKNYSPEFYFHKEVSIINPFISDTRNRQQAKTKINVQFFPEGGNLVEGIRSKVAFQVLDNTGSGTNRSGVVVDEKMDTVVSFSPDHFGIGHFYITPEANKKYKAILQLEKEAVFELPDVAPVGYALEVSEQTESNQINIRVRTNTDALTRQMLYLFVHARNKTILANAGMFNNNVVQFDMDIETLPEGISHITIFDAMMKPVCERLFFKQPTPLTEISITPDQARYLTRGQVKIDLDVLTQEQVNPYDLSVSVYKIDSLSSSNVNIQNHLLLTSDLKGDIESPDFYFGDSPAVKVAVDNLMLTHGWRRFRWEEVFDTIANMQTFIPEVRGHIVTARVERPDNTAASGVLSYLTSPGKIIRLYPSRSGQDGRLYFEMLNFYGKAKIIVQKYSGEDSTLNVKVNSPFSEQYADRIHHSLLLSEQWKDQLIERSVAMQAEDIYKGNAQFKIPDGIDSTAFYGKPDATYLLDDFTRFPVMEEVLREYVPGVFVRKRKEGFQFLVVDKDPNATFRVSPLILLDGVPIFDEDEIMNFDPRKIKRLDVVQHRWLQGPVGFFGIVSFSTYNGDLAGFELNPNAITMDYEGIQLQREFYTPKYESKKQRDSRLPDQRTQLYWNPMVTTDSIGHAAFEFYTSDLPGDYKVVVEGMNKEGKLVTSSTHLIVKDSNQ